MKYLLLVISLIPLALFGQTTYQVEVGGSTLSPPAPYYLPQFLTIDVGDIVEWHQVSGSHNVAGTTALFPDNPEGFTSGEPATGTWSYSHTFTLPGFYQYHCTQPGHNSTQHGNITVLDPMIVNELRDLGEMNMYPVPCGNVLNISTTFSDVERIEVNTIDGRCVVSGKLNGNSTFRIDTHELLAGNYFVTITNRTGRTITQRFTKQ